MRTILTLFLAQAAGGAYWLHAAGANIRASAASSAPVVGELRHGDRVVVTGCVPACDAGSAWALLGDAGAIKLSLLAPGEPGPLDDAEAAGTTYDWGRAIVSVDVLSAPRLGAHVLRRADAGDVLALVAVPDGGPTEWRETWDEGFVPGARLRLLKPSSFQGEPDPLVPLAFFVRETTVVGPLDGLRIPRFARLPALGLAADGRVRLAMGSVPRLHVRLAFARPRPPGVGPAEKWVHVDLAEQVLTAYEGDRLVFATLVSTGKPGFGTEEGLYHVWRKIAHDPMHGEREPYHVEEVPDILYFHESDGLHGTFWHSAFGFPVSHGCVNLSMADAAWLFAWAPPPLPAGWHAILPQAAGLPSLWVRVERAPLGRFPEALSLGSAGSSNGSASAHRDSTPRSASLGPAAR